MRDAAQLTRTGRLVDATQLIQRALRAKHRPPRRPPRRLKRWWKTSVIEAQVRVVEMHPTPEPRGSKAADAWTPGGFTHQGRSVDYMLFVPASASAQPAAARPWC